MRIRDYIVLIVILCLVFVALYKLRRRGCGCGNCSSCPYKKGGRCGKKREM